jgi:hypothetical protein
MFGHVVDVMPGLSGVIRRRILVNYRADPEVVQQLLPSPFRPKLLGSEAVVGVCLVRLEQLRPTGLPQSLPVTLGWSSENAAHRIAVEWTDAGGAICEGVYIPRRDTNSLVNHLVGGRLFPGRHRYARFAVRDEGGRIDFTMRSGDGCADIRLLARPAQCLPPTSRFASLDAASAFFAGGAVGYSPCRDNTRLEGLRLCTEHWHIEPLDVLALEAGYFTAEAHFPPSSMVFDCALIMRNVPHEWIVAPSPQVPYAVRDDASGRQSMARTTRGTGR